MNTLVYGQAKPTISRVEGVCESRVGPLLNEAQMRLLNRSDTPVGSVVEARWCIGATNCIVFPRPVRSIEAYSICNTPGTVRPTWFAYIGYPNGAGYPNGQSALGNTLIDKGTTCAFDQVVSSSTAPRRIAAIASDASDAGKKITLRYYNASGQRVYTSIGGIVQEGEQLTLVAPGPAFPGNAVTTSQNVATNGLYLVVKETTNYPIYLYEYDPTPIVGPSSITKQLAQYEPSETTPIYRQALVPGLTDWAACDGSTGTDCTTNKSLTALVKLQHVPVVVDNDPLVIGNLPALKLMVMAILREEANRLEESAILEQKARAEIDGELSSYMGDGARTAIRVESDFGAGLPCVSYGWTW